jgi:hypothetical protein
MISLCSIKLSFCNYFKLIYVYFPKNIAVQNWLYLCTKKKVVVNINNNLRHTHTIYGLNVNVRTSVNCQQYCTQLVWPPPSFSFHPGTLDNQLPPAITSELSLRPDIQDTAFCQKNGIRSERTQNKFLYSVRMEAPWLSGPPRRAFCRDIIYAPDRYPVTEVGNICMESMTLSYWDWVFCLVLLRTWFTLMKYCRDRIISF